VSARANQQANDVDHWQTKTEAQASGRAPTFHHGVSEMTALSGHGQHPTTDSEHLLTAPRVSLSPQERVRFHAAVTVAFLYL